MYTSPDSSGEETAVSRRLCSTKAARTVKIWYCTVKPLQKPRGEDERHLYTAVRGWKGLSGRTELVVGTSKIFNVGKGGKGAESEYATCFRIFHASRALRRVFIVVGGRARYTATLPSHRPDQSPYHARAAEYGDGPLHTAEQSTQRIPLCR